MILESEMFEFVDQNYVFIVDEYHYTLVKSSLQISIDCKVHPIFDLGVSEKGVLSTGHRSKETNKFMSDLLGDQVDLQINKSLLTIIGEEQSYNIQCFASSEE